MGTQLPPQKGAHQPRQLSKFTGAGFACVHIIRGPCLLWPNGWMDEDETWHGGRPRPWSHCFSWQPSSPSLNGAEPFYFRPHVCCGQTTGWIKMPLAREVSLGPGHIVLDGDPAVLDGDPAPRKGAPLFSGHVYCGQTVGHLSYC